VRPAAGGAEPTWSGFSTRLYGRRVAEAVRAVLASEEEHAWLHVSALERLTAARARHRAIFDADDLEWTDKGLVWWTFAGGRINTTLRHAFAAVAADWKIVASNFSLRFEGEDVTQPRFHEALNRVAQPEFWEDERLWLDVAGTLPNYRLSKFQPLLPPWTQREMVASFLLDIEGAADWLLAHRAVAPDWSALVPAAPLEEARAPAVAETAFARPRNPVVWVNSGAALEAACAELRRANLVGLDVETTLSDRSLCLIQLATPSRTWVVDPLVIDDLAPLAGLLADSRVTKVIHNAAFERGVLGRHGMVIEPVLDTLQVSRRVRAADDGGHSLAAVCERELGLRLDKGPQTSDWRRRPLSARQLEYAALDAEVLLLVVDALVEHSEATSR
jgi:ATP-dependent Lhr-like helicase